MCIRDRNKTKQKTKKRFVGGGGEVNRTKQLNRAFITKKHITRLKKLSEGKGNYKVRHNLILYIRRKEMQSKIEETEGRKLQIHTHNQYES